MSQIPTGDGASRTSTSARVTALNAAVSLLAIMALLAAAAPVAHAQTPPSTPTVSTVAVTSDPGSDNTYATGDKIEVTVTFSEAVTVSTSGGTPRLTIDIGDQPRNIPYDRAGTNTGQLIFAYTVFAGDMDADGISVQADGLALNGGTIQSADDSTDATLTFSAQSFATHKVDTEVVLVSNIGQADASENITISATQSAEVTFTVPATDAGYDLTGITLDVKSASSTLDVAVEVRRTGSIPSHEIPSAEDMRVAFSGSTATAGRQTFTPDDIHFRRVNLRIAAGATRVTHLIYTVTITGSGEGTVEIGATASSAEDTGGLNGLSIQNPTAGGKVPRLDLVGHTAAVPFILHTEVLSSPADGSAYKAGERIELMFVTSRFSSVANSPSEAEFWLGNGREMRRTAQYVTHAVPFTFTGLIYSYEVRAGDVDSDGILIAGDALGHNANSTFTDARSGVPVRLSLPSLQQSTDQSVRGSQTRTCQDVLCGEATVTTVPYDADFFTPVHDAFGRYTQHNLDSALVSLSPFMILSGSLSARTFVYGDATFAILSVRDFHGISNVRLPGGDVPEVDALVLAIAPEIPEDDSNRLALSVDGTLVELRDLYESSNNGLSGFYWHDRDVGWADGDTVQIKLVEVPVTATFDAATYAGGEGDSLDVTVTLEASFETKTVTLPLVATGADDATSDDYSGVPSELVFAPGETEKTFTIDLTDDTIDDDDESITLSFGTLPDTVKRGGDNETATVTIRDDDDPEVDVEFGAATYTAAEGGTAEVEVTLSDDPERTVTIPLTRTDQGGISSADYSGVPASVTFNATETSKTFTFTAAQDDVDDDDESVRLEFGTLPARVSAGTTDETTISIDDDDDPRVTVGFGSATYSAEEGSSTTVRVTLSQDPERTVIIPLIKTEQGGVSSADYSGVPASVTFNSGETSKTFTFTAAQDDVDDDDESVKLALGALPARVTGGTHTETTLSIDDDDNPHVKVQFTQDEYTVVEGSNVGVRITLDKPPEREVTIPIVTTHQDGATAADYTFPASVTFEADQTEKTVTFEATDDDVDDFGESVKLTFGTALPDRITVGPTRETTVNIWQQTALDCSTALLCADVNFADRTALDWGWNELLYHKNSDPASSITQRGFQFGGVDYNIVRIRIMSAFFPEMENPLSWSFEQEAHLLVTIGYGAFDDAPATAHHQDWTLYVGDVTLPLSQAKVDGNEFHWWGAGIQNVFAEWTSSTPVRIGIMETPYADQPEAVVPGVPRRVYADASGSSGIIVRWWKPYSDGGSAVTGYKVQWKEAGDSWTDAAAVSEKPADRTSTLAGRATITGLTAGTLYTVRVVATNAVGDSEPTPDAVARPQSVAARLPESFVNGRTLTLRYGRDLDPGSKPATGSFVAIVNGGMRPVDSVAISGREVRLTLSSAVSAADTVTWVYQEPVDPTAAALRDSQHNYQDDGGHRGMSEAANQTPRSTLEALTARFTNVPASHDGETTFTFNIEFSDSVWMSRGFPRNDMLRVSGGTVTSAHWIDRNTRTWAVTVRPQTQGSITVTLPEPAGNACTGTRAAGAVCGPGDRRLSARVTTTIPIAQTQGANAPATGSPGIDGSPRVGETLTATTSGVADADGMTGAAFAYQWIRQDLASQTDTDIEGATDSIYTVAAEDAGQALKVRVTFTDDAGNQESVTSYGVIASDGPAGASGSSDSEPSDSGSSDPEPSDPEPSDPEPSDPEPSKSPVTDAPIADAAEEVGPALTASIHDAPDSHDGRAFTFELRFSEQFEISFRTLRDDAFTVTGGKVVRARRLEKGSNVGWAIRVRPDSSADVTVVLPAAVDCDATGAICTDDGRMLSTRLDLTVRGPDG